MKAKLRGLAFLVIASMLATGCSTQGKVQIPTTVIINEDVQLESSLADSSLEVSRQDDIEIGKRFEFELFRGNNVYFNKNGRLYSFNNSTGEEKELANREIYTISENGNRGLSYEDENLFIRNFETGESKLFAGGSPEHTYFADDDGNEIFHFSMAPDSETVSLVDVDTNETVTWDLSSFEEYSISFIEKIGDDVYIPAGSHKDGYGIYQLTDQKTIEIVESFHGKASSINEFDFLGNNTIIFRGSYDGKDGIFLLNRETGHVQLLVAGGESSEGRWTPFYNLSPDESKIMFDTPVQIEDEFKANIYIGEIVDGKLTNSGRILENADTDAVISYSGYWSEDSKTAYIATNENGGTVAVFNVK